MGNQLRKKAKVIDEDELLYDAFAHRAIYKGVTEQCPFDFYLHNDLWDKEFQLYYKNLYNSILDIYDIDMPSQILNVVIIEYLKQNIYEHWYPKQYILNNLVKQQSLIPKNFKNSRKSQSISNNKENNIMKQLIDKFDFNESLKQLSDVIEWGTYFEDNYLFHEIVIYEKGDYFKKHVDTIYEMKDPDNKYKIHKYDYTLIIIPPS